MPPWSSRILSANSSNTVRSPIALSTADEGDLDNTIAASLHDVPILSSRPSQPYSLGNSQEHRSSHGRSVSHPFPTMVGSDGMRRFTGSDQVTREGGHQAEEEHGRLAANSSGTLKALNKSPAKNGKATLKDDGLQTGNCLTCGSTVRWPKQLDVYRCTNCLMINDIASAGQSTIKEGSTDTSRAEDSTTRKTLPLTVHKTKHLAEQCLTDFLQLQVEQFKNNRSSDARPSIPRRFGNTSDEERPDSKDIGSFQDAQYRQNQNTNPRSFPPTRQMTVPLQLPENGFADTLTSSDKGRPAWKQIFTALEDYLLSCLQDCNSLNAAFTLERPTTLRSSSEASNHLEKQHRQGDQSYNEEFMFELDAKTLLLGDIGENGQWWTGERPTKPVKPRKEEERDKKPSRFDWGAIYSWYDAILSCGKNWRLQMASMPVDAQELLVKNETQIDDLLSQGRYHVQRTFLKGIETLLRRPHRPLLCPEDVRFLVILLVNPLLYPRSTRKLSSPTAHKNAIPATKRSDKLPVKSQGIANGHHSGIVKRLLGLISNLSLPCHQALISWFCRVSELQFRDLVELVGGFVSYRLARQTGKSKKGMIDVTAGLIPDLSGPGGGSSAHLHAAIGETAKSSKEAQAEKEQAYRDDWQVRAAAKVMALLFSANMFPKSSRYESKKSNEHSLPVSVRQKARKHSQLLPTNFFYNTRLDFVDLVGDFEAWEARRGKFSFCQYPMFLSIWAKIHILEYDARRQMEIKARDAFFTTIMKGKAVSQFLVFKVRRDCLADDSLKNISQIIGGGEEEVKKSLRIEFIGEEGVDAGGLRKEWFLLLTREVFDPEHGLFVYDADSHYCYFNPFSFETSDQFFLIGVLLGLAIYNSTILDVSLPPFAFRKLLASAPNYAGPVTTALRSSISYTLGDLAEWRPSLARGLQQLLDHEGDDVEEVFCRDFVIEVERYGQLVHVPLCPGGERKAVTNSNRHEFVDLYVRYLLDVSVARQYEPFKRGFFSVCGGNALSLFRPEEIELLIRGSDEPLDTASIRAVAVYENCSPHEDIVTWFWEIFEHADSKYQREILAFITGSDRVPGMGATSLVIKIARLGNDTSRFPIARTCFNSLGLWSYRKKKILAEKLWRAVQESEGFGLK